MILFIRVWFGLVQTLRHRAGEPIRALAGMLALWIVPLLVVAPLFSKDVYSYAAQGEMMSHHINPYNYGPGTIGSGQYVTGVAALVEHPRPLRAILLHAGGVGGVLERPQHPGHGGVTPAHVGGGRGAHRVLHTQAGPGLRSRPGCGVHGGVLNPLTLLALIGGAHNDAMMLGLLLAGITAAK